MRALVRFAACAYAAAVLGFIFLPVATLVLFSLQATSFPIPPFTGPSLRWYEAVLSDPRLTSALLNSFLVAFLSSLTAVVLGFLSAWGFARFVLPGAALLRGLITLPLTVSYLIIGMGLLVLFNALGVPKSLLAAGIGHVVINLPLCFAIIYSQLGDHQITLERAARDIGASEMWVLVLITVPVMAPAILASLFLSMTFSWDEFLISFLLTRFETTLPVEIWNLLRSGLNPKTNAIGSMVFAVSIVLAVALRARVRPPEARMTAPLVEIRGVSQRFGQTMAVSDVSLTIAPGSYTVLLGPSGSGKTTLLSILGGFLIPTAGRVAIGGVDCTSLPPARRPTTTVFQDYAFFPHMSVGGNVGFGLRMRGVARARAWQAGA